MRGAPLFTNLVTDPSFEGAEPNDVVFTGNGAVSTHANRAGEWSAEGKWSYRARATNMVAGAYDYHYLYGLPTPFVCSPGKRYGIRMTIKLAEIPTGGAINAGMLVSTAAGGSLNWIRQESLQGLGLGTHEIVAVGTADPTSARLNPGITCDGGASGTFDAYIDRVMIVEVPTNATVADVPEYFDGDTPLGGWSGTPNASQSILFEYVEGQISEDLVAAHEPWITDDLAVYLRAIGGMFAEVELYAFDTDDFEGWSILLDVDRCPAEALPYLAQYVGERLPIGLTEEQERQWIRDAPNQRRGTLQSIVDAGQRYLTGGKNITVIQRDGGPDRLTIVSYTDQTPNSAQVLAELYTVVPADISLTYVVSSGQIWSQVVATDADWANSMAESATWADLMAETPSGTYG